MQPSFKITKTTREGQKPRCLKEVSIAVIAHEENKNDIIIRDEDLQWGMVLRIECNRSLACLIAENLPEPILRRELFALGFVVNHEQVDS